MVEEIYDIPDEIEIISKKKYSMEDFGKYLNEVKKKFNDELPVLDIINEYKKLNGVKDINDLREYVTEQKIFDILDEISETERECNKLKANYFKQYINPVKDDNLANKPLKEKIINNILNNEKEFESDLEKYNENKKLVKKMESILSIIGKTKNIGLENQFSNMKKCMHNFNLITKDDKSEQLSEKGHLFCDIQNEDDILLSELLSSSENENLSIEEIGLLVGYCLKEAKKGMNKKLNTNQNSKYNILKNKILEKAKKIADIFEEHKIFEINEDKNKYLNNFNFNDNYMELIYKWIKSDKDKSKFNQLMKDSNGFYSKISLVINVIRKIKEVSENFEKSNYIGKELKEKFKKLGERIKLPFGSSIYYI